MSNRIDARRPRSLSLVMPYYNEELNVEASIGGALEYLRKRFSDFQIVAVDDHSSDRTLEIARRMQAAEPRIDIVALPENTKFAGALKRGFAAATKEYVFYTDGDCPIDYNDIDLALDALTKYDVVIGYRTTRDREGLLRRLYTTGYRLALRALFGIDFKDVNFSFKLFPKSALSSILIESNGSFIDAEILYRLKLAGYRVGEVPVNYFSRRKGVSTLASPAIIVRILREMISFRMRHPRLSARKAVGVGLEPSNPADCQRR